MRFSSLILTSEGLSNGIQNNVSIDWKRSPGSLSWPSDVIAKNIHAQDEKIEILINMQIQSEERFNERFARNEERFERMHQTIEQLVAAQTRFEENLQALIQAVRRTNFGGSLA